MKICSTNINDLLQDGFTTKFAKYYLKQAEAYFKMNVFNKEYSGWALSRGFLADSACWYDLSEKNVDSYVVAIIPSNSITATLFVFVFIDDFEESPSNSYALYLSAVKNAANKQRMHMPNIIFEINDAFIFPHFMIIH